MEKIFLKCPKCSIKSEVLILAGVKGILTSWAYRCNNCRLQKTGGFWFLECLYYSLLILIPLILFILLGPKFASSLNQQYRFMFLVIGGVSSLLLGFVISKCYLKGLLKKYLKSTKDNVPNILG